MEEKHAQTDNTLTEQATEQQSVIPKKYIILGIAVAVIMLVILIFLMILAVRNPLHTETFRDIAIIALAAESGLIGLALIVLIIQVARLINMLEFEIKPILIHTSKTASTVRGTATFMSEHVVSPMIKASGFATGLANLVRSIGGITGKSRVGNNKEKSQRIDYKDTEGGKS